MDGPSGLSLRGGGRPPHPRNPHSSAAALGPSLRGGDDPRTHRSSADAAGPPRRGSGGSGYDRVTSERAKNSMFAGRSASRRM
ncbi:hypothetical protein GCM10027440_32730 [Nocardiopsis coralliicola]